MDCISMKRRRDVFSKEEDEKLVELTSKYSSNWCQISCEMKNRSSRQCKERYIHYLSPSINSSNWTVDEDKLLEKKVQEYGKKWKLLEQYFNQRTEINIRNRWNKINRRNLRSLKKIGEPKKCKEMTFDEIYNNRTSYNFVNVIENNEDQYIYDTSFEDEEYNF